MPHYFGHISFKRRISWSDVISASRRLVAFPQDSSARSEECDPLYRSHRAHSLLPCQLREGFTVASIRLLRHCPMAVKGLYISPQSSKFHSGVSFDLQGSIQYEEATHISSGTLCIYYFLIWDCCPANYKNNFSFKSHTIHIRKQRREKENVWRRPLSP